MESQVVDIAEIATDVLKNRQEYWKQPQFAGDKLVEGFLEEIHRELERRCMEEVNKCETDA